MTENGKLPQTMRDIWTDAFKYHTAIEDMGNTVQDWRQAYEKALAIYQKHGEHPLALRLLQAVYEYAEQARYRAKGA